MRPFGLNRNRIESTLIAPLDDIQGCLPDLVRTGWRIRY
ncbi:MAG: hypothetical protein C0434_06195 [Xanthomonadaceae bacterium]|nr:hypothetical protein [Xanthomonadaceae bacterium]